MAGRERMRLSDAAIARLRPREREYTVWDSRMPGPEPVNDFETVTIAI